VRKMHPRKLTTRASINPSSLASVKEQLRPTKTTDDHEVLDSWAPSATERAESDTVSIKVGSRVRGVA
jgi:hypothetical protein